MESPSNRPAGEKFNQLVALMERLRGPGGCPWDREQTFDTIKPYTVEETYEVLDAIDQRDWKHLAEELGDFLLQGVFYAQMAEEAGHFRIEDCLEAINAKLIRRHPHIFSTASANTADDVLKRWDEIKAEERASGNKTSPLLLDSVPRSAPALVQAQQISDKAARTGFDWEDAAQVAEKLHEELQELAEARASREVETIEEEIGDAFFTLVNLARLLRIDPEQALRKTNQKFRNRFNFMEKELRSSGRQFSGLSSAEWDQLWREAKVRT